MTTATKQPAIGPHGQKTDRNARIVAYALAHPGATYAGMARLWRNLSRQRIQQICAAAGVPPRRRPRAVKAAAGG